MRTVSTILLLSILNLATSAQRSTDGIYYLSRDGDAIRIAWIDVPDGAEVTLPPEAVSPVLPIGVGQSGDIQQEAQTSSKIVVRNTGGAIGTIAYRPDGSVRDNPPVSLASLRSYEVRVNIITGKGWKKAFAISGYASVEEAAGPVVDLFRGMIPLGKNDVSTTLVTTLRREAPQDGLTGSAIVHYEGGLILTEVKDHKGDARSFIVDFGAGATVVTKAFLPEGTRITELTGIERSDKGDRIIRGSVQAAGGDVSSFLGQARLSALPFGDISVADVTVNVIGEMPRFGDREISGIIGIDILQRGGKVTFSYGTRARLILGEDQTQATASVTAPFTVAGKHIFLEGGLGGRKVMYLFDTGARFSIVSGEMVANEGIPLSQAAVRSVKGLDGRPMDARTTEPLSVSLNGTDIGSAAFSVIELPVLRSMGLQDNGAILGNDVLSLSQRVQVDFGERKLRFWR